MVVYHVTWTVDKDLAKGKGRVTNKACIFSVICRCAADAMICLDYHFHHHYENPLDLTLDDGVIQMHRSKIDSRNFTATYMLMDNIREPIYLSDLKKNLPRCEKIFGDYARRY